MPLKVIDTNKRPTSQPNLNDKKSRNPKKLSLNTGKFSLKSPRTIFNTKDLRRSQAVTPTGKTTIFSTLAAHSPASQNSARRLLSPFRH